jgi:hypothetical protein
VIRPQRAVLPVFEKFSPAAHYERLWPPLVLIAAIAAFGLLLLIAI